MPGFLFLHITRHRCATTPTTGRGTIPGLDVDVPDFGYLDGLTWLVRQAWIAEIEAAYREARAGLSRQVDLGALGRRPPGLAG